MNIRQAEKADKDFIVQCQIEMALETEDLKLERETLAAGVNNLFEQHHQLGNYWIAQGDEPMGLCLTLKEWSDWRNKMVLWIHSVYVLPAYRKKGVYKSLYNHVKSLANTPEYAGIRLYVDKRNTNAQQVYQRLGMNNQHYELYEWLKD